MRVLNHILLAGAITVLLGGATTAPATQPATTPIKPVILAHRALYNMELDTARNGSPVVSAGGQMVFEWQDACDGWNVEQRMTLNMGYDTGDEIELKSAFTTWEAKDGTRYRFNYRQYHNGQLTENYRGSAKMAAPGQGGTASYTQPEDKEITLPVGSYFPTAHTLALIDAAIAHQPMFSGALFDGTDKGGYSDFSAIIGKQQEIKLEPAKTGLGTTAPVAWPIRMAFYPSNNQEATPDYEMDTTLLPNGVSEYLLLDYGEFKLRGTLEKVEILPKPDC